MTITKDNYPELFETLKELIKDKPSTIFGIELVILVEKEFDFSSILPFSSEIRTEKLIVRYNKDLPFKFDSNLCQD
jgi:hypothetical protein